MPYANINATLLAADQTNILLRLDQARALMPFLINLNRTETKKFFRMGKGYGRFLQRCVELGKNHPNLFPPYLQVTNMERDHKLWMDLDMVEGKLAAMLEAVRDTRMALQQEALSAGVVFYKHTRDATKFSVPGADTVYNDLHESFANRTGKRKKKKKEDIG